MTRREAENFIDAKQNRGRADWFPWIELATAAVALAAMAWVLR
jgi:hypothetical protein